MTKNIPASDAEDQAEVSDDFDAFWDSITKVHGFSEPEAKKDAVPEEADAGSAGPEPEEEERDTDFSDCDDRSLPSEERAFGDYGRAFDFSFSSLVKEPVLNEEVLRVLIGDYKKLFPYQEKIYFSEARLEEALGNMERSMEILSETVSRLPNASQCAMALAERQMDRGMFAEVIRTCNYAIAASCKPLPDIDIPQVFLLRALARDALLHHRAAAGEKVGMQEISDLLDEYVFIQEKFSSLRARDEEIGMRISCLEILKLTAAESD